MGYIGNLRWRVRIGDESVDAASIEDAVRTAFAAIFRGAASGSEAASRSPVDLDVAGDHLRFLEEPKFTNGWRFSSRLSSGDVGAHSELFGFVVERVARAAEDAWAIGVQPARPPSLSTRFSFRAFSSVKEPQSLCRDLEIALNERLQAHPSPAAAFEEAMKELKAAGHDLWSYTPEEVWGPDYVTPRPGSGLLITRFADDDDSSVQNTVKVEFKPRAA